MKRALIDGVCGALCVGALLCSVPARADIPAPETNECYDDEGATCDNAGPKEDTPGLCKPDTCEHGRECLKCQLPVTEPDGTAGAASAAGAAGATATDASPSTKDGDCSVGVLGSERGIASLMLGLGLAALVGSRRYRRA